MPGAFANKFIDWLPHSIIVEPYTGSDDYGHGLYGPPISYKVLISAKVQLIRDLQGQERSSNSVVYVLGGPFDPRDRVTMPSEFKGPQQPVILSVANFWDHTEFSHSEVYL